MSGESTYAIREVLNTEPQDRLVAQAASFATIQTMAWMSRLSQLDLHPPITIDHVAESTGSRPEDMRARHKRIGEANGQNKIYFGVADTQTDKDVAFGKGETSVVNGGLMAYVRELDVLPGMQRQGLGRLILTSLVHRFIELARLTPGKLTQATVGLGVLRPNVQVVHWCERLTFKETRLPWEPEEVWSIGPHDIPRLEMVAGLANIALQLGFYGRLPERGVE